MLAGGALEDLGRIAAPPPLRRLFGMRSTELSRDLELRLRRRRHLGEPGQTSATLLAAGEGWRVDDMVCTRGPQDRPFEERHSGVSIAVVVAGTFQYRSGLGRELLVPGALMLGNDAQCFECGHEHGQGDRCVAFRFSNAYFERIAADVGGKAPDRAFATGRLPPTPRLSALTARTAAGLLGAAPAWDELGVEVAVQAVALGNRRGTTNPQAPAHALPRVTESIRRIERDPAARLALQELAREANLSPFHYLRSFERITGVTPHQYILRVRLREAAVRLTTERTKVAEIGFSAGFSDLSNFNHAFRAEFGMSPRRYRTAGLTRRS